jgi:hypothetical protein
MLISRRGLITGLAAFVAAPAIVRATSLMPVKSFALEQWTDAVVTAVAEHENRFWFATLADSGSVNLTHTAIGGPRYQVGDRIRLTL